MTRPQTALSILLLAIQVPCWGQRDFRAGYVVKANRDSVVGQVRYAASDVNETSCQFRANANSEIINYSPKDLGVYGWMDGKRFRSLFLKDKESIARWVFAEVLVQGRISLFRYDGDYYVKKDSLILLPEPQKAVVETPRGAFMNIDKRYVGILNSLMAECTVKADEARYEAKDIAKLVEKYNQCMGGASITAVPNRPWTLVNWQLAVGVEHSSLELSSYPSDMFKPSVHAKVGLSMELSASKLNDKFFFVFECWYLQPVYQGSYDPQGPTYTRVDYLTKGPILKIPIGVRFNLLKEEKTLYFKLGVLGQINLKPESSITYESDSAGVVTTSRIGGTSKTDRGMGFWASIGYQKAIHPKFRGFAELRAETLGKGYTITNLSLLVGIRF